MGIKSREHRERREQRNRAAHSGGAKRPGTDSDCNARIEELEEDLRRLAGREAAFGTYQGCTPEERVAHLEDILAFESVESGVSLFEGLQEHGLNLPRPEHLDEPASAAKVMEVLHALAELRIFLIGFDHMSPREFYSTLWRQILWEACYVERRNSSGLTVIDVSHGMSPSDFMQFMEKLQECESVH